MSVILSIFNPNAQIQCSLAGNLELIEDGDDQGVAHDHVFERDFGQWFDIGVSANNDRDMLLRHNRRRNPSKPL